MASIIEPQVVYIEPNAEEELGTAYASDDDSVTTMKIASPEDFCVVVDLEVEVKGRTYYFTKTSSNGNIKKVEAVENANGQTISFMEGTRIYTNKEKTEYITSLTTNYTDCTLEDISNGGTSEMFGIKSIDISYNNFMVPEVTIQFTDVRGVSLFAQEELRHNLVNAETGMQANVNENIAGSFFKSFFTFPYPKFTLRVKGFYGEMVSYELTCSDFRAAFEATTGNFNVTAKFVGYAFSFLNDVMANAILAAPYSTYIGKEYWESNNGNRFVVKDKNGVDIPMTRLMEICQKYQQIKEDVEAQLSEGGRDEEFKRQGLSDEQISSITNYELSPQKGKYQQLTEGVKNAGFVGKGNGEICIKAPNSHSFAVFVDQSEDYDVYRQFIASFSSFNNELKEVKESSALQAWTNKYNFELVEFTSYTDLTQGLWSETDISSSKITDKELKEAIESMASKVCPNTTQEYHELWTDWDNSHVFVYIDNGLYDILGATADTTSDNAKEAQQLLEDVTNNAINHAIETIFDFPPTLENVTKMIMAHFETYCYMIAQCSQHIIESGMARSAENLGLSKDSLNDLPEDSTLVPPFPSVTQNTTDGDGNEKVETTWIGTFDNAQQFEEVKLVEGLLTGVEETAAIASMAAVEGGAPDTSVSNIVTPLYAGDLLLDQSDKAFGNINTGDLNDVFAHVAMRGYTILSIANDIEDANSLGISDAANFIKIYGNDTNINVIKQALADGNLTADKVYDYLTSGDLSKSINPSAKSNPWYIQKSLFKKVPTNESKCMTSVGAIGPSTKGRVWPIKNWTFQQLKDISSGDKAKYVEKNAENFYATPLSKERAGTTLNLGEIRYKSVGYFKRTLTSVDNKMFEEAVQDPSDVIKKYDVGEGVDASGDSIDICDVISYDDKGAVKNADGLALDFNHCFDKQVYYSENKSIEEKALYFLDCLDCDDVDDLQDDLNKTSINHIYLVPKLAILKIGAYYWSQEESIPLRNGIKYKFINEFKTWVNDGFKKILASYEMRFKTSKSYEILQTNLQKGMKPEEAIDENCENANELRAAYTISKGFFTGLSLVPKVSSASKRVIEDLCQMAHIVLIGKYNNKVYDSSSAVPSVAISDLKSYLNGIITELRNKLNVSTDTQEVGDSLSSVSLSSDTDDIKYGVYVYIKMLYDKWISADLDITNYKFETMFGGDNPTFHFIDSYYNKIGKSYYINISTLVKMLIDSQTQNGYSLLSLLSNLYASNKMQFLCIQNFADLANSEMMKKMFKPIPYIEMTEPNNHPDFVVLYPGEASSKLDVQGGEYRDDGFYLNDRTTWPIMIKNKQAGGGYPVPAFGVSYGQQYQSYFQNVQVDMNTPMATEQSIKAKFMIAGGMSNNENNGPKEITVGQDLYTIYSNNSYQCTVTMLGCAWVQPMMYFTLLNVPMFRGSYLISKVTHQIGPGTMTTTFTGTRMANTATRAVKQYIIGQNNDSTNGDSNSFEARAAAAANLGNDCEYAFFDPFGTAGGQAGVADINGIKLCEHNGKQYVPNSDQKKNMSAIIPLMKQEGSKMKYNMPWTILAATVEYEVGWKSTHIYGGGTNPTSTAKGIGQILYPVANSNNYKKYFNKLIKGVGPDDRNVPSKAVPAMAQMMSEAADDTLRGITLKGKKYGPYKSLQNDPTKLAFCAIARYHDYYAMVDAAEVLSKYSLSQAINGKMFRDDGCEKLYWFYNNYQKYGNSKITPNNTTNSASTISQLVSGFTEVVQNSLNSSDAYREAKLTYEVGNMGKDYAVIQIKATGNNAMNATFDCISTTYTDYWEYLYWSIGNGQLNNDCVGVVVKLVATKPKSHRLGICKAFTKGMANAQAVQITKEDELNKSLKLALIKHCRKESISDAVKAKACIKSFSNMDTNMINKILEFGSTSGSAVESCGSAIGFDSALNIPPVTKNNRVFSPANASNWIESNARGSSIHKCATYVRQAIEAGGIPTPGHPVPAKKYVLFLPKIGFGHIATLKSRQEQAAWTQQNAKVGDIAVMDHGIYGHICMYTHKGRWASDFKQNSMWVYQGDGTCYIFRFA